VKESTSDYRIPLPHNTSVTTKMKGTGDSEPWQMSNICLQNSEFSRDGIGRQMKDLHWNSPEVKVTSLAQEFLPPDHQALTISWKIKSN